MKDLNRTINEIVASFPVQTKTAAAAKPSVTPGSIGEVMQKLAEELRNDAGDVTYEDLEKYVRGTP